MGINKPFTVASTIFQTIILVFLPFAWSLPTPIETFFARSKAV
jgi:hypothetical protein